MKLTATTLTLGLLMAALSACGSTASDIRDRDVDPRATSAAQLAFECLELMDEYHTNDTSTASEAELERQMEEVALNEDVCGDALVTSYTGPGGNVMAQHLARAFGLHGLQAELALSYRFDQMAGYCAILTDIIGVFNNDLNELETELQRLVADGDVDDEQIDNVTSLMSLHQLTYQSMEISVLDFAESCS